MANILISVAQTDMSFGRSLRNRLEKNGNEALFTSGSITTGRLPEISTSHNLLKSDAIIIVLSGKVLNEKWMMHEARRAESVRQTTGRPVVLLIVIDDIQLPDSLSHFQAIFAHDQNLDKIVEDVFQIIDIALGRIKAVENEKHKAQEHIEATAETYIRESLEELRDRESTLKKSARCWYNIAFSSLIIGLIFGLWRAWIFIPNADITWKIIAQLVVISIIIIGILSALSRYAFVLGRSYMVESLRNADRIHAISFGHFYLKAYGEQAEWSEIKEAFQHWNIDTGSSFIKQEAKDIDPEILKTVIEIAKILTPKGKLK